MKPRLKVYFASVNTFVSSGRFYLRLPIEDRLCSPVVLLQHSFGIPTWRQVADSLFERFDYLRISSFMANRGLVMRSLSIPDEVIGSHPQ